MRRVFEFNGMVGQKRPCKHLKSFAEGARKRGVVAPSVLLAGPAGYGKTSLAEAYGSEIGTKFRPIKRGRDVTSDVIVSELRSVEAGDVLFIDEAHALPLSTVETLLLALDEQLLPIPGTRENNRPRTESIAEFTLILATNKTSEVDNALRSRLATIDLAPYEPRELAEIIRRAAEHEDWDLTAQAARELADAAQGSPRLARHLLRDAWLICHERSKLEQRDVREFLQVKGIDEHGLTPLQREVMLALYKSPRHTLTAGTLAAWLANGDTEYLADEADRWLVRIGFLDILPRGRTLTPRGLEVAKTLGVTNNDAEVA